MTYGISYKEFDNLFSGIADHEIIKSIYYKGENYAQQSWIYRETIFRPTH